MLCGLGRAAWSAEPPLQEARNLYQHTDFEASLQVLLSIPDRDGPVWELIGRNQYMLGDYKKATDSLENAVKADPENPVYELWLGRAFGRRAETSSPFTAPGQASKARQCFERAVQLNPHYLEAYSDLFEYYLDAPGFLGGGIDKAEAAARQISTMDAAEGYWAQSKLDEKRKQDSRAEEHLRRAVEAAPRQVGRLIDLAKFLAKRGRFHESDQSFARADKLSPNNPKLMYARADVYIKNRRNLRQARQLLEKYMSSALTPDDPPKADAAKLLKQLSGG